MHNQAEIVPSCERRTQRDGTDDAIGFDVQQYLSAIVVAMYLDLEQLENWQVLPNELLSEPSCLDLRIGGVSTAKELDRRSGDPAIIRKFETDLLGRPDGTERRPGR